MSADMRTPAVLRWRQIFHLWTWRMQSAVVRLTPRSRSQPGRITVAVWGEQPHQKMRGLKAFFRPQCCIQPGELLPSGQVGFLLSNVKISPQTIWDQSCFCRFCLEFDFVFLLTGLGKAEFSFLWFGHWSRVISQSVMIAWKEMKQSVGIVFKPKWGLFHL